MTEERSGPGPGWALWRQDDNGHRFLVCVKETREAAERIRESYELLGHKQLYFIEPAGDLRQ